MAGAAPESALIRQYNDIIEIYTTYANNVKQTIEEIKQVQNEKKVKIYQEDFITFNKMLQDSANMGDEIDDFKKLGLYGFIDVGYYIHQKKTGFLGNFVNVVLSIVQIVVGAAIGVASSGFLAHFSSGLIASGIKDILVTAITTIEGKGMELKKVFNDKTLDLAVNAITAGLKTMASSIATKVVENSAEGSWKYKVSTEFKSWAGADIRFGERVFRDTMITVTTRALDEVTKVGFDTQKDQIEEKVYEMVEKMLSRHNAEITRIAAHDAWRHQRVIERALIREGEEILQHHYLPGYKQIHQEIMREVGGRIPYIGTLLSAYEVVDAANKVIHLTDKFCAEFEAKLPSFTPDNDKLMEVRIGSMGEKGNEIRG